MTRVLGSTLGGLEPGRLRLVLGIFFLALALPAALLVWKAYEQLQWESFRPLQIQAEELGGRIDRQWSTWMAREEARSFADYGFLVVEGDLQANFLQRSPLSAWPPEAAIPGLLGYFQIDAEGLFSTPLLPDVAAMSTAYGIPEAERAERSALAQRLLDILARNQLVDAAPGDERDRLAGAGEEDSGGRRPQRREPEEAGSAPVAERVAEAAPTAQKSYATATPRPAPRGFDRLEWARDKSRAKPPLSPAEAEQEAGSGRWEAAARLGDKAESASRSAAPVTQERGQRRERRLLAEPLYAASVQDSATVPAPAPATVPAAAAGLARTPEVPSGTPSLPAVRIRMLEGELDPFSLRRLDSGHLVLYRQAWRDGRRTIQGVLIESLAFVNGLVGEAFYATALAQTSDLIVRYQDTPLAVFEARPGRRDRGGGTLLHRTRLSTPAGGLELRFGVGQLPAGPGAWVVRWLAASLGLVLAGGVLLLYRLGLRQIALSRQQQDFVSSVSHELKTPLTSIRLYAEMLREGWTTEERKRTYYEFICSESERLSRLIQNVLQLARLTRNELHVRSKPVAMDALLGELAPRLASQVETAGFRLRLACTETAGAWVRVDEDFLIQILINLADNAVKFSRQASRREIVLGCRLERDRELCLSVRDYGPGIPRDQMKKIFRLFYRSGNALTRETLGTGIGLALVRQLALAMQGRVDAIDANPGAELRIFLPLDREPPVRLSGVSSATGGPGQIDPDPAAQSSAFSSQRS